MRKFSERKLRLITLSTIFGFSLLFLTNFKYYQRIDYGNIESDNKSELKRAGYWEIGPIEIDDDFPTKNWTYTEATYDWCSGSGTVNDPYLIENVTINGQFTNGIYIMNSNVFFIIRNCTIYNSSYGIRINRADNGRIIKNNCSFNDDHGISLSRGDNILILNNIASNNRRAGIALGSFHRNCTISGNLIFDNGQDGIVLRQDCDNNTIRDNIIYRSGYSGILLQNGSGDNIVKKNTVSDSYLGIWVYWDSHYNTVQGNRISKCETSGIYIEESQYNIVKENVIHNNFEYGINLDHYQTENNEIYLNDIIGNLIQANDNHSNNHWDNGTTGNFWSDYAGTDSDDNGIGDTPYNIVGSVGSQDRFPLIKMISNYTVVIINSPKNNEVYHSEVPEFDIDIYSRSLINTSWYTIDDGIENYTFTSLTGTINRTVWEKKNVGPITLKFYARNCLGYLGFNEVEIIKEPPEELAIPGFDISLFIITISLISFYIFRKIKYKLFIQKY